jgi:hypothetical protein
MPINYIDFYNPDPLTPDHQAMFDEEAKYIDQKYSGLLSYLDSILPESRHKSLMVTNIEESQMWAKKALLNKIRSYV